MIVSGNNRIIVVGSIITNARAIIDILLLTQISCHLVPGSDLGERIVGCCYVLRHTHIQGTG